MELLKSALGCSSNFSFRKSCHHRCWRNRVLMLFISRLYRNLPNSMPNFYRLQSRSHEEGNLSIVLGNSNPNFSGNTQGTARQHWLHLKNLYKTLATFFILHKLYFSHEVGIHLEQFLRTFDSKSLFRWFQYLLLNLFCIVAILLNGFILLLTILIPHYN